MGIEAPILAVRLLPLLQARFLLVKLNPSSTHTSANPMSAEVINTDDVSLAVFTEHLKRLAVQT